MKDAATAIGAMKSYFAATGFLVFAWLPPISAAQVSSGTAFAVAPGMLVTNQHVVDGCGTVEVISKTG